MLREGLDLVTLALDGNGGAKHSISRKSEAYAAVRNPSTQRSGGCDVDIDA